MRSLPWRALATGTALLASRRRRVQPKGMRTKQRGVIQALSISVFNFCSAARKLVAVAAQAGAGEEAARHLRLFPRGNAPTPRFVFVAVADECPRHDARPPCLRA